ncbi:MAG: TIGR03960 family B12-binding radical SAM protein [Syntrophobacteraceae bacterium]
MDNFLFNVEKPGRYLGAEVNARRKDFDSARARVALAFPDVYEVGMSHLGLRLLYQLLNDLDGVVADRVYAPWYDFEENLRSSGEPLRTVESRRPLKEFDFVGFSLQYELSYTNILTILDLGGIPLKGRDRGEGTPWVMAGGPCAYNPEPLADFLDFVVLGEAEQVLPELLGVFFEWRSARGGRREFLEAIRHIPGVYVPSFFSVTYEGANLPIRSIEPVFADYRSVEKRVIADLDQESPHPVPPLVPVLDIIHNRLSLEIARGCTRGCRFCQAGFIYRPVRERHPQKVYESAEKAIAASGFEEISLLSFSTGDYCQLQPLLAGLMDRFEPERIAVSFPSMRVGTLTPELMKLVRRVRKTGFTLAPEAGSERLRRVINKGILDKDLLETADNAFQLGWRVIKLYFMIGLPTENGEDLQALIDLSLGVWKRARPFRASINVSVSTFVPKPFTPFQWMGQIPQSVMEERLRSLKDRLQRPALNLKWNQPQLSRMEAVFARGDRRLGPVLERAWRLGARFDGWTERFRSDLWEQAFGEEGVEPSFYADRERPLEEILPWDHLSPRVEKEYLQTELKRAYVGEYTPDCRWASCSACGACDHKTIRPLVHAETDWRAAPVEGGKDLRAARGGKEFLYWVRYGKTGNMRFLGQLDVAQVLARALRRAGAPIAFSSGFHPHPKISFVEALPLGYESLWEEAYVSLTADIGAETLGRSLNGELPEGLAILDVAAVVRREAPAQARLLVYRVGELSAGRLTELLGMWKQRLDEPLRKKTKKGFAESPLGDVLLDLRSAGDGLLEMDLLEENNKRFRPSAILQHLLGESFDWVSECRICKVGAHTMPPVRGRTAAVRS